jgi:hypothetical protein
MEVGRDADSFAEGFDPMNTEHVKFLKYIENECTFDDLFKELEKNPWGGKLGSGGQYVTLFMIAKYGRAVLKGEAYIVSNKPYQEVSNKKRKLEEEKEEKEEIIIVE